MTTVRSHSSNSIDALVDSLLGTNEKLDPLRIAIIQNINKGFGEVSIKRACDWFEQKYSEVFIGEIPENLQDFLSWLRPTNPGMLLNWANAALSCIETELYGQSRSEAMRWLNAKLTEEIGASSAAICIADYLRPARSQPQSQWAEKTFRSMMHIQDPEQKGIALQWLEDRIAEKLGQIQASTTVERWVRDYQEKDPIPHSRTQNAIPRRPSSEEKSNPTSLKHEETEPVLDEAEVLQRAEAMCAEVTGMELEDAMNAVRSQMKYQQRKSKAA